MSKDQKINHAIYKTTRIICREIGGNLNMDFEADAVDLIGELAMKQLMSYAADLEAFEKHAKRSTITSDDVKLLARRNDSLKELLEAKLQNVQRNKPITETANIGNKRKRKATNNSSS